MTSGAHIPSEELLQATHKFPGPYIFKAIGEHHRGFVERVVAAVRDELGLGSDPNYEYRTSSGGKHAAVTINVWVLSAADVRKVYHRLLKVDGLVILL